MAYVPDPNDAAEPTSGRPAGTAAAEFRALKQKLATIAAGAVVATAVGANSADIQTYISPDPNDRPAMAAGGWLPWNLNQQWGGAGCTPVHMVNAATGAEFKFDAFDGYIDSNSTLAIGDIAGRFYVYQGLNPAKNLSLQALWVKIYKNGNPIDNLVLKLWSVAAGLPNAVIATADVINGRQITNDTGGQWYRFSFAVVQALVAGTQYIFTLEKSGGIDAANFYVTRQKDSTKFPNNLNGTGTAVPVWTATNTISNIFLCEAQTSDNVVQSAGQFNGRIVGSGTGNPVNRSTAFCKPLAEFFPLFHPNGWSIHLRGKSWTKDRTIFEAMYGLHHDRINVRCAAATGFTTVTLYEADGTVNTVVGTSDISTAAFKDILIVGRSMGDAGDYLKIYTGVAGVWTKEAEAIAQDYDLDPLMLKQGTAWIMGGFQLHAAANYTQLLDMSVLPSAAVPAWTFTTTTATVEGNVFAISGGKLNQIKAGMAAGGDGFYVKAAAGFNNANGSSIVLKQKIIKGTNTNNTDAALLLWRDGTRQANIKLQEYYLQTGQSGGLFGHFPQIDLKNTDNTLLALLKGNDVLVFNNGRLIADHSGFNTVADASNDIQFGDQSVVADENADVIWDYFGYYNTAAILPQFTAGELHEFAVYSGDKNSLGSSLYNLGVPLSIKQFCGLQKNYVGEQITQSVGVIGITSNPTATTPDTLEPEMEHFVLGAFLDAATSGSLGQNTAGASINKAIYIDSVSLYSRIAQPQTISEVIEQSVLLPSLGLNFGLHKLETRISVSAGIVTSNATRRTFNIRAKAFK